MVIMSLSGLLGLPSLCGPCYLILDRYCFVCGSFLRSRCRMLCEFTVGAIIFGRQFFVVFCFFLVGLWGRCYLEIEWLVVIMWSPCGHHVTVWVAWLGLAVWSLLTDY